MLTENQGQTGTVSVLTCMEDVQPKLSKILQQPVFHVADTTLAFSGMPQEARELRVKEACTFHHVCVLKAVASFSYY